MKPKRKQGPVASDKSSIVARLPNACRDERAAVEFFEEQRWGSEPFCPRCGVVGECYQMRDRKTGERSPRYLWRCRACKKMYTVRANTVFEDSPIPMRIWCLGFWLACSSKKGVSALQIKRLSGLSYKSSLFMMHRIRFAMGDAPGTRPLLTGIVESDETYTGGSPRVRTNKQRERQPRSWRRPTNNKECVLGLVERGGEIRPIHIDPKKGGGVRETLLEHVSPDAKLMTDESPLYTVVGRRFASHETVKHSSYEYARVNADQLVVHVNTAENFFSLFKRGLNGTFHSVSPKHLHRYLCEFEYRYNTRKTDDGERTVTAIRKAVGKRLKYRTMVHGEEAAV